MEASDPLVALFEDVPQATATLRAPLVAMPAAAGVRLVPRPRWQLSAGFALAAAAAVTFVVANQPSSTCGAPHVQAQTLTDVQRVTSMIRTAEQNHDPVALHEALVEAKQQLVKIDAAHVSDPRLTADLSLLGQAVASLPVDPDDPETDALITSVEALVAAAPGVTPEAQPSPDDTSAPTETPMDTPGATPEPTPEATVEPTPAPPPDATATPQPTPDATPSPVPDAAVPPPTDPTAPV
jgi:hypothetical protein